MRMMLKARFPIARGNAAIKDGSFQKVIQATLTRLKPEATYFYPAAGYRNALIVFDLPQVSDMVSTMEPLWLELEAELELLPAMNLDDLTVGLQSMPA